MKDMTFQIEKMTTTRQKIYEKDNTLKPRIAMLNLCDVILEVLATMQTEHEWEGKRESPPDREIRNPLTLDDRRNEVMAMLNVCANELENKVLFPILNQTEVPLTLDLRSGEVIIRNSSFLVRKIIETIEKNK